MGQLRRSGHGPVWTGSVSWGAAQAWPVLVWRSRSVWIRPVVVRFGEAGLGQTRYGGHGPIRSVKFWCISVRHGHGTAVGVILGEA